MSWFINNLFQKWFTPYHKANDSYKNANDEGLVERYVQTFGNDIDQNIIPLLDNFLENNINPKGIIDNLLPYREQELGVNLVYDNTIAKRRQILQYWLRLVQIKATKRGYEACLRLMTFENLIIETVDVITFFDNPIPAPGCNACYEYDVIVTATRNIINLAIVDAFFNITDWNEPINCHLRNFVYNDTLVPKNLVFFYYKGVDDENLYVDIKRNPTFLAEFDTNLDNEGKLLLEGDNQDYYEFDSVHYFNEGFMMFRKPTPTAYLPFVSNVPTNITTSSATLTWEVAPDALYYLVNVGRDLKEEVNEVIVSKVVINENVGNTLTYEVTNLLNNTPYYSQILAVRANNDKAISHPQPFITLKYLDAPIALEEEQVTVTDFVAVWLPVIGATGYFIDVATDLNFTNLIVDNLALGNVTRTKINYGGVCYYRVRARYHTKYTALTMPAVSQNSNIIFVRIQLPYVFIPFTNSNNVSYTHNLGSYPIYTTVYDSDNNVIIAALQSDFTTITATFNNNYSGTLAILLTYPTMQTVDITNQTSIVIPHGLGRKPIAWTVYDSLGNVVICAENADDNNLTLEFSQSFTGTVLFI
jgi:hypothetical protein